MSASNNCSHAQGEISDVRRPHRAHVVAGVFGILVALASACAHRCLLPDKLSGSRHWSPDGELPQYFRVRLLCNMRCRNNVTRHHLQLEAAEAKKRQSSYFVSDETDWPSLAEEMCATQCMQDFQSGELDFGDIHLTSVGLPVLHKYLTCTTTCANRFATILMPGRTFDVHQAVDTLKLCGVVPVPLGPLSGAKSSDGGRRIELIESIRQAYDVLRSGQRGTRLRDALLDAVTLRSNREQFWLPYEKPFSRISQLLAFPLGQVLSSFLRRGLNSTNSSIVLDYVNVLAAPANTERRQALHRDFPSPDRFLEVHVPLLSAKHAVPMAMGPTRFCPCLHGDLDLTDSVSFSLLHHLLSSEGCAHHAPLCWTLDADNSDANTLWSTVYDNNVFHQGLENYSPEDRPVLVMSVAESQEAAQNRSYHSSGIADVTHEQAQAMERFRQIKLYF